MSRISLRGSFLENAPVVAVSAKTGDGLENLKAALVALAGKDEGDSREARGVRLPIDRAFLVPGFGPVVTGSLVSGSISRGQKLELLPRRLPVRVRRVEVHGREEDVAYAGERVSVNLAGADLEDLKRGLTLASPRAFAVTSLVTARVELLAGAALKAGDRVSLHHYSAEVQATLGLPESREILSGRGQPSQRAQLRLSSPIAAAPGDRFVLRRLSPVETIGGGTVLDPLAPRLLYRAAAENRAVLDVLESGALSQRLVLWIEQGRSRGADEETLAQRAGVTPAEVRAALAKPEEEGIVHVLRRTPDRYVGEAELNRLAARAGREMAALLSETRGAGVPRRTLLERLLPGADARWAEAVEAALIKRGTFVVSGDEARPPGREDLPGVEGELSLRIADAFRRGGLAPPSPGEVAIEVSHRPKVVLGLIGYLVKKGDLVRLPGGWIVAREAVQDVVNRLRASGKASIDVGEFKEMFGLTRKLAIPMLEHLDETKVTRRVGDSREILKTPPSS